VGVSPNDGVLGFALGAEMPIETFAAAATADVGGAHAKRRGYLADGPPVAWRETVDAATGEPCVVAPAADGTQRCLPAAEEFVAYYTDSTCSRTAFAHARTGCPADAPHFVRDAVTPRAFVVGEALPAIFTSAGGACTPFTPVVPSDLFAADEAAPDRFPLAVRVTE
jgi:hypothetical protein